MIKKLLKLKRPTFFVFIALALISIPGLALEKSAVFGQYRAETIEEEPLVVLELNQDGKFILQTFQSGKKTNQKTEGKWLISNKSVVLKANSLNCRYKFEKDLENGQGTGSGPALVLIGKSKKCLAKFFADR